jgi:hypothetical protein
MYKERYLPKTSYMSFPRKLVTARRVRQHIVWMFETSGPIESTEEDAV